MVVEVDDVSDLLEHTDPELGRVGHRCADPVDPPTSGAFSRAVSHAPTVRPRCTMASDC